MKLKAGDIVEVHGWPMLDKLPEGRYRITTVAYHYTQGIYLFTRPRGHKILVRHYACNVDPWVRPAGHPDLNKIVIESRRE